MEPSLTQTAAILKSVPELVYDMAQARGLVGVPRQFTFSRDKLFFLATTQAPELFYVNLPKSDSTSQLEWLPVLNTAVDSSKQLSKEELLRRERMRVASGGITSYVFDDNQRRFLLPAGDSLYIVNTDSLPALSKELVSPHKGTRIDPKFSTDGTLVSFIRNNDLWVQDIATLAESRLTLANPTDSPKTRKYSGVAEYIIQEEFDRFTGYWWSPKSNGRKHSILYVDVDETELPVYNITEPGIRGSVDEFIYPLVGEKNAAVDLAIVDIDTSDSMKIHKRTKKLYPSLKERFPWMEYLPRAGWTPEGNKIWVQLLDRKQQKFVLATIDIAEFYESIPPGVSEIAPMHGVTILREEQTDVWINITDLLHFFEDGSGRVLIGSEVSGFRHLYLLTPNDDENGDRYTSRPVTAGDNWLVDTDMLEVDEEKGFVYFTGTKDSPLEAHLYVASLDASANPSHVVRLTSAGFTHRVTMSGNKSQFVSVFSNIRETYRTQVYSIEIANDDQGRPMFPPSVVLKSTFAKPHPLKRPAKFAVKPPELFSFKNTKGETLYGCYFTPRNFDPTKKYPTILKVYGGPHVQLVSNDYSLTHFMVCHLYAHLGYLVVMIDGVGSWRRGLKFEGYLRKKMGQIEVQEQVEGLSFLVKQGFVDTERIAVTGWSYGGYLSLLCLAQRPDFFKVAVSAAPVTKWESYDTGYTERYMGTPTDNPVGYEAGSVMHYIDGFPDGENRLMIIHGLLDENVHFCNTSELIQKLIEAQKPYQLQLFPQERHGVRNPEANLYLEQTVLRFFLNHV